MIIIGAPQIVSKNGKSRLISKIKIGSELKEVYYEVDEKYKEFLCHERVDSFVVALLPLALKNNMSLSSDTPISKKLFHQLTKYFLPTLSKYIYGKEIMLNFSFSNENITAGKAVGTGLSSGVDSFYTIGSHTNLKVINYSLTHLTFFNVGSHGNGINSEELYRSRLSAARKTANELNFELVEINSNIDEVLQMNFVSTHTFRSFSAVLALQKLFSVYYYASGYPIDEFKISSESSAYYDLLTVMNLSTENTSFYSAGIELTRLEKVNFISGYLPSHASLNVCTMQESNCGECEKCVRTQLELYCLGHLDLFGNVFDIEKFKKNLDKNIGFMLLNRKTSYYKEIIDTFKRNDIKISFNSKIYFIYFGLKRNIKRIITNVTILCK